MSIVVNNYNNEKYLARCFSSIENQTYKNIEVIIVDAFSSDESRLVIKKYCNEIQKWRYVFTKSYEEYPAVTYNLGFLDSHGEYIAIFDPDDFSLPDRVEDQVRFLMDHPNFDCVGSDVYVNVVDINMVVRSSVDKNLKMAAPPVRNPTLMFRRSILARHGLCRWSCEYAADFDWIYGMYHGGSKFHQIGKPLVVYTEGISTNVSSKKRFNQGVKIAIFRIKYGILLRRFVSFFWWYATLKTIAYLVLKYPTLRIIAKVKMLFNLR